MNMNMNMQGNAAFHMHAWLERAVHSMHMASLCYPFQRQLVCVVCIVQFFAGIAPAAPWAATRLGGL